MPLWIAIVIAVVGSLAIAAAVSIGLHRLFPGRVTLLSDHGGPSALRAITNVYALILAFVLASSLQSFLSAQQQTVSEGDAVVAVGNLALELPSASSQRLRTELACYASSVVHQEFPAMESGQTSQLDDDSELLDVYHTVAGLPTKTQAQVTTNQAITQQMSTLSNARDARIRAAKTSLPVMLWVVVIAGGAILILAVGAMTYVDRPWARFGALAGLTGIIVATILVIVMLQQPYRSEGLRIDSGSMHAALVSVSRGLPPYTC